MVEANVLRGGTEEYAPTAASATVATARTAACPPPCAHKP